MGPRAFTLLLLLVGRGRVGFEPTQRDADGDAGGDEDDLHILQSGGAQIAAVGEQYAIVWSEYPGAAATRRAMFAHVTASDALVSPPDEILGAQVDPTN